MRPWSGLVLPALLLCAGVCACAPAFLRGHPRSGDAAVTVLSQGHFSGTLLPRDM